jgi:hypothetical protein
LVCLILAQSLSVSSTAQNILSYSYLEKGFMPAVTCIFNSSCAFSIVADGDCGDASHVYLYTAKGYLPNSISPEGYGQEEAYPVISGESDYWPLVAWASRALNGRNVTARSIVVTAVQSEENEIPASDHKRDELGEPPATYEQFIVQFGPWGSADAQHS